MATYLYCIHAEPVSVPAKLYGIDGAPVRSIGVLSLDAWVSDVLDIPLAVSVDRIKAHDAVCAAALAANETPLPIRFGQTFADDDEAKKAIAARASELGTRLRRVAGCVELRVVMPRELEREPSGADVATDEDGSAVAGPGTAFLKRLAREGRADIAREVACEEVRHAMRTDAKELIVDQRPCETARGVSYFALLVRRRDVESVRDIAAASHASRPTVMGPFAPYSFSGDA